ncbi:MAG: WD40/YVTN/BNR-like repeat-containing protein [Bacillota bacterium]
MSLSLALAGCARLAGGDGAKTAEPTPPPPAPAGTPPFTAIDMVEATTGWATAAEIDPMSSVPSSIQTLWRTTDGGVTWKDVTPRFEPGAIAGPAHFLDVSAAWLVVSRPGISAVAVFRTFDGGAKWRATTVQTWEFPRIMGLTAADADHVWMLATYGATMGSEPTDIFASDDGGYNWRRIASARATDRLSSVSLPYVGHKMGLTFASGKNGWINGNSHDPGMWLQATLDGGKTWAALSLTLPGDYSPTYGSLDTLPPIFFKGADGIKRDGVLPVYVHAEGKGPFFYVTHDSGQNWSLAASPKEKVATWSFVDAGHGFALGGGKLWVTTDGGQTWTELHPNYDLNEVTQIDFVSDQLGWAIGKGFFIKTADAGKTWGPVTAAGK